MGKRWRKKEKTKAGEGNPDNNDDTAAEPRRQPRVAIHHPAKLRAKQKASLGHLCRCRPALVHCGGRQANCCAGFAALGNDTLETLVKV